jgi:hypothetical protein
MLELEIGITVVISLTYPLEPPVVQTPGSRSDSVYVVI